MDLVVDANILFSALLKKSLTAELLFQEQLNLYTPEFILDEFFKYETFIETKMKRSRGEFVQIMHALKEIITVVPQEEYSLFLDEAKKICPDEKDVLYLALALKLKCAIWSNDKRLKEQKKIPVYSTSELLELL